jgi:hypothetical protein
MSDVKEEKVKDELMDTAGGDDDPNEEVSIHGV